MSESTAPESTTPENATSGNVTMDEAAAANATAERLEEPAPQKSESPPVITVYQSAPPPDTGAARRRQAQRRSRFFYRPARIAWFIGSLVMIDIGVTLIATTFALYLEDGADSDILVPVNTTGWAVAGTGLGSLVLFFPLRPRHREGAPGAAASLGVSFGANQLFIHGAF